VSFVNANIMITPANIQSSKISCITKSIYKVIGEGDRIGIFYSDFINRAVVLDKM
jgi:hypothetical protein